MYPEAVSALIGYRFQSGIDIKLTQFPGERSRAPFANLFAINRDDRHDKGGGGGNKRFGGIIGLFNCERALFNADFCFCRQFQYSLPGDAGEDLSAQLSRDKGAILFDDVGVI